VIYITGDTHGSFGKFYIRDHWTKDDIVIILGDVGINYFGDERDRNLKIKLSKLPMTLFCIHGNHEMRPFSTKCPYELIDYRGGKAYIEKEFPNLIFAKDGEIYDFDGKSCMVMGGAYSVDKYYRLENNKRWYKDEQPSETIKKRCQRHLNKVGWKVDIVLSHTCPIRYMPKEMFIPMIDQSTVDNSTEIWLGELEFTLNYKKWYCGHYHTDKSIDKMRFMFMDIIKLGEYIWE